MIEEIKQCFAKSGYQYISTNVSEIEIYLLPEKEKAFVVLLFLDKDGDCFSAQQYDTILHQIRERLLQQGYTQIKQLSIIVTEQIARIRENYQSKESYWIAVSSDNQLIVYENQNFGEKGEILRRAIDKSLQPIKTVNNSQVKPNFSKLPWCTIILVAINCIMFLLVEVTGSSYNTSHMLKWGAMYEEFILDKKEYFRFITSMFLHFGINHLVNNMFVLIFVGKMVEEMIGKIKFLFLYFATGILASVVSIVYNMIQNNIVVSAGASGAIFGIIGVMVLIVFRNRGKQQGLSIRRLILFAAVSFYAGIYDAGNVDVAAHVGGFLSGILLAAFVYRKSRDTTEKAGGGNSEG